MSALLGGARARAITACFDDRTVLIVGDVMLDHFLVGRVNRISPEAPVPVVEFEREEVRLGGAANVAHNARALGARVDLVGIVGDDEAARTLERELDERGLGREGLVRSNDRPTTRKMRVVTTRNQQVVRIDFESDEDVTGPAQDALIARAVHLLDRADVVVVSDYLKGVVTDRLMAALRRAAQARDIALLVDPKIPHLALYADATLVTPNHHEAAFATAMRIRTEEDARLAAREFQRRARCESVLITRGEHGMWLLEGRRTQDRDSDWSTEVQAEQALPARAREVADVTGAGDTVIATIALALAAGAPIADAAALATYAASVSVQKFGPAAVTREELLDAVDAPA